ncbi:MAG: hypothetical protein ACI30O_05060 [Muribaculaceae bacterium]
MSFFLFVLFAFLIVFIVIPVFKAVRMVLRARKQMRDAFNGMFGESGAAGQNGTSDRNGQTPRRRRKKIAKDVGEYVEFEEIACTVKTTDPADDGKTKTGKTIVEQQIEDVEWEDLP